MRVPIPVLRGHLGIHPTTQVVGGPSHRGSKEAQDDVEPFIVPNNFDRLLPDAAIISNQM